MLLCMGRAHCVPSLLVSSEWQIHAKMPNAAPPLRDDVARSFLLGRFINDVSNFFLYSTHPTFRFVFASDTQYRSLYLNAHFRATPSSPLDADILYAGSLS